MNLKYIKNRMIMNNLIGDLLIFLVYPGPRGSEENQFTSLGDGVTKLIFKRTFTDILINVVTLIII
jgi:hypothetical protein